MPSRQERAGRLLRALELAAVVDAVARGQLAPSRRRARGCRSTTLAEVAPGDVAMTTILRCTFSREMAFGPAVLADRRRARGAALRARRGVDERRRDRLEVRARPSRCSGRPGRRRAWPSSTRDTTVPWKAVSIASATCRMRRP